MRHTAQICTSDGVQSKSYKHISPGGVLMWTVSQMATYWFVIGKFSIQKTQKSEVRQAAKYVVKSEV